MKLDFGFSPCPNDTFMFWGWVHGLLSQALGIEPRLADIQQLNELALNEARWAFTKVSIATYLDSRVQERYRLLDVGAALGRGCGPLVVTKRPWAIEKPRPLRVAVPGRNTTAFQLAQMSISPFVKEWVELRYDEIMPAVIAGDRVDAGVIIHESRFTYQQLGLHCIFDLGRWWEQKTGLPLPLGVMVARRDIEPGTVQRVEHALQAGIALAWQVLENPNNADEYASLWGYLRENAIELEDDVMRSHIQLYVNEFSSSLGPQGREAIATFQELAGI